jgi:protein ImuB
MSSMTLPVPGTSETAAVATRTAAVLVPAWPLLAARDHLERHSEQTDREQKDRGQGGDGRPPLIVTARHRVLCAEEEALTAGVAVGMRTRAARAAMPHAIVIESDRDRETALFELVAAAVDTVAAGVDVLRPGVLLMAARGPARHQGGEAELAEKIIDAVADLTGWDCSVGIADGPFAALLAARSGRIVRPGRSGEYLAPHGIGALGDAPVDPGWGHRDTSAAGGPGSAHERSEHLDLAGTIDLLERLGITTLGQFAALPSASVQDRFGPEVAQLHVLAGGGEVTPPAAHHPDQPIEVVRPMEPPLVRADQAAFAARPMAEELHGMLVARGLVCTRLRILARTEGGQELERTWRHDGALSPADVVDRVRWQCDGWITGASLRAAKGGGSGQVGAITRLSLVPVQLMPAGHGAPTLWGSAGEAAQRAGRAFARAQGLAGEESVLVPAEVGGRLLSEQVAAVPWRSERPARRRGPWPGSLPRPVPSTVFPEPPVVRLWGSGGADVDVDERGLLSGIPARIGVPRGDADVRGMQAGAVYPVRSHGRVTVLDERWWSPGGHRTARLPVVVVLTWDDAAGGMRDDPDDGDGRDELALLLLRHEDVWRVEGVYD